MEERDALIATALAQTRTNLDRLSGRHARHYRIRRRLCLTRFTNSYRFQVSSGYVQCVLHPNLPRRACRYYAGTRGNPLVHRGAQQEDQAYHRRGDGALWFTEIIGKIERITT